MQHEGDCLSVLLYADRFGHAQAGVEIGFTRDGEGHFPDYLGYLWDVWEKELTLKVGCFTLRKSLQKGRCALLFPC